MLDYQLYNKNDMFFGLILFCRFFNLTQNNYLYGVNNKNDILCLVRKCIKIEERI